MRDAADYQVMRVASDLVKTCRAPWIGPALAPAWRRLEDALGLGRVDGVREAMTEMERAAMRGGLKTGERILVDTMLAGMSSEAASFQGWADTTRRGIPAIRHTLGATGLAAVLWATDDGRMLDGGIYIDAGDTDPVVPASEFLGVRDVASRGPADGDALRTCVADAGVDVESWFAPRRREVLMRAAEALARLDDAGRAELAATEVARVAAKIAPAGGQGLYVVLLPCSAAPKTLHVSRDVDPVAYVLGEAQPRPVPSPVCWGTGDARTAICFFTMHDAHKRGMPANRALLNDVAGPTGRPPMPGRPRELVCDVLYGDAVAVAWDLESDEPKSLTAAQVRRVETTLESPATGVAAAERIAARAGRADGQPAISTRTATRTGRTRQPRTKVDRSRPHG